MLANKEFSSNGKLLLSGEYLVMKGALALAVPLKKNHTLRIRNMTGKNEISWESYDINEKYFSGIFSLQEMKFQNSTNKESEEFISHLLLMAKKLNKNFPGNNDSIKVTSHLNFSRKWGWGSSSTSISNIAQWAGTDPFELFFATQKGSAYDIACSFSDSPILYQLQKDKPLFEKVEVSPVLKSNAFFIYTGIKADTRSNVDDFISANNFNKEDIEKVSVITKEIASTDRLDELICLLDEHEKIISSLINAEVIQQIMFPDFLGQIKSLGAWGGDFIMAVSQNGPEYIKEYFSKKDLYPIFAFDEIVLC